MVGVYIFTGEGKRVIMQSEDSGICDECFEGSVSVWIFGENTVKESGISDRFSISCEFGAFFVCS